MLLIAVGKLKGEEHALFTRYNARLRPPFTVHEIAEAAGAPADSKRREAAALLAALPHGAFAVALDLGGKAPSSEAFAALLASWREAGHRLAFLIGGAEGLDASVLARAGAALSLGAMTWPHMLVRVMLAEQVYRAQCILAGHPYHRGGRP